MKEIPIIILVLYILAMYGISWYANNVSKEEGAVGYLLAGRKMPFYVVAVMIAGLAIGGASTVGVAENAYNSGLSAGMYNAAWATGAVIVGLVAAKKFRDMNIKTIPQLLENHYGLSGRVIGVIGQIIIQIVITSLQFVAGGAILAALLPETFTLSTGMMVTAIVFIGITFIGGYWGAGLTNLVNVTVIYIGVIIGGIMSVLQIGGFSELTTSLPQGGHWFNPVTGVGIAVVIAWFMVMITQSFSVQAIAQISFAAKDSKEAKKGFILGGLIILPIGFISALIGIVGAAQYPGIQATMALPKVVTNLNPILAGMVLSGLWAADVSTGCGLLMGSSTLVVEDIYKRFIQKNITDKKEKIISRTIVLTISIITYFLASNVVGILETLLIGLSLTTAYTVIVLFTMFAPSLCKKSSAFWTLLSGIAVLIIWTLVPATQIFPHVIFMEWAVTLPVFLIVSQVDKRPAKFKENKKPEKTAKIKTKNK